MRTLSSASVLRCWFLLHTHTAQTALSVLEISMIMFSTLANDKFSIFSSIKDTGNCTTKDCVWVLTDLTRVLFEYLFKNFKTDTLRDLLQFPRNILFSSSKINRIHRASELITLLVNLCCSNWFVEIDAEFRTGIKLMVTDIQFKHDIFMTRHFVNYYCNYSMHCGSDLKTIPKRFSCVKGAFQKCFLPSVTRYSGLLQQKMSKFPRFESLTATSGRFCWGCKGDISQIHPNAAILDCCTHLLCFICAEHHFFTMFSIWNDPSNR